MNPGELQSRRILHAAVGVIAVVGLAGAGFLYGSDSGSDSPSRSEAASVTAGAPSNLVFTETTPRPHQPVATSVSPTDSPEATDTPPAADPAQEPPAVTDPTPEETDLPPVYNPPPTEPPPVAAGGLRVWSDGDSTSYFMSVWLLQMMVERGATQVQPQPEYQISSGLLSANYFDWPAYISSQMAAYDPNLVVFMLGANDAHPGMDLENYRAEVAAVMDQLAGRTVIWVGQPNMPPSRPDLQESIPGVNQVFAEEAAKRPWVGYVDAWSVTSDADGNWAEYLPDENGALQQVRAGDGVHFTYEGGRRLALAVLAALP